MENFFYRKKLPHWQPPEGTFFITYRLFGSIPKPVIERLKFAYDEALHQIEIQAADEADKMRREQNIMGKLPMDILRKIESISNKKRYDEQKRYFKKFDDFLDGNLNEPHFLKNPAVAALNAQALHFYEEKLYKLWAYCIMSNHVHVLLTLLPEAPPLWKVMQDIKKYTGTQGNKILGRKGEKFWEDESYDHLVRAKEGAFERILFYILNNPVKAGMVKEWTAYEWSFCHPDLC
ncbi:MAG TPA: transposase [Saprospiraceae bacterium]|nr:transposase [Saprospiraceae bacterium]HMQ82862.1 transposase [Saprospiraceae bacterium]